MPFGAWSLNRVHLTTDVAPSFYLAAIGVLAFDVTLLGGDGGGPRSGAVRVAKRSGPPVRSVDRWAHPTEPRVRPVGVVVRAPGFERSACMGQRSEQGLIEQLVPQAADEGLGKGILHGLARRDVVPSHLVIVRPLQDDVRGQFGGKPTPGTAA